MHSWPVQDAKFRFSKFLDACLSDGPQMVTRRDAEAAVLVPLQGVDDVSALTKMQTTRCQQVTKIVSPRQRKIH